MWWSRKRCGSPVSSPTTNHAPPPLLYLSCPHLTFYYPHNTDDQLDREFGSNLVSERAPVNEEGLAQGTPRRAVAAGAAGPPRPARLPLARPPAPPISWTAVARTRAREEAIELFLPFFVIVCWIFVSLEEKKKSGRGKCVCLCVCVVSCAFCVFGGRRVTRLTMTTGQVRGGCAAFFLSGGLKQVLPWRGGPCRTYFSGDVIGYPKPGMSVCSCTINILLTKKKIGEKKKKKKKKNPTSNRKTGHDDDDSTDGLN